MIRSTGEAPETRAGRLAEGYAVQKAAIKKLLDSPPEVVNAHWQHLSAMIWAHCDLRVLGEWQERPVRGWIAEHINAPFDICLSQDGNGRTISDTDLAISMISNLLPTASIEIRKWPPGGIQMPWELKLDTRFSAGRHQGLLWGFGHNIAQAAWRAYFSYVNKEPTDV
ncbi:hypothetical protein CcrSwift_gp265 [Caulobacter phage CcrSwift]|uniref:Uncharacterized protein n=1 Tax=Caulobacter phage CcrSwift TaxID=2927984 RepID=K4JXB7_9CAUD|nr:hypothetical protein D870_gp156 [Caulobacter phage CcrSwift]AFU88583.1 hypothetical protein CcrSwift_gp265 [Caulobacter phage CcrSwift]